MFENYLATNQDLEMIEKALHFVWRKELDFIFKERDKIVNTLVVRNNYRAPSSIIFQI